MQISQWFRHDVGGLIYFTMFNERDSDKMVPSRSKLSVFQKGTPKPSGKKLPKIFGWNSPNNVFGWNSSNMFQHHLIFRPKSPCISGVPRSRALELKLELALAERSSGTADAHRPNGNHRPSDGRDGRVQDRNSMSRCFFQLIEAVSIEDRDFKTWFHWIIQFPCSLALFWFIHADECPVLSFCYHHVIIMSTA